MKRQYLSVIFLLIIVHTTAAQVTPDAPIALTGAPQPTMEETQSSSETGASGIGTKMNLCGGVNLGIANTMAGTGPLSIGYGFTYQGSLGVAFQHAGRNHGRSHGFLNGVAIEACYGRATPRLWYDDAQGVEQTQDYKITWVGLPVTYTGVRARKGNLGFYCQLGINFDYLLGTTINGEDIAKYMNKLLFFPSISTGITINTKHHSRFKGQKAMIGPFISYNANNMSAKQGFTINCVTIGLRIWAWQIGY